jgi:hypothetical protein
VQQMPGRDAYLDGLLGHPMVEPTRRLTPPCRRSTPAWEVPDACPQLLQEAESTRADIEDALAHLSFQNVHRLVSIDREVRDSLVGRLAGR